MGQAGADRSTWQRHCGRDADTEGHSSRPLSAGSPGMSSNLHQGHSWSLKLGLPGCRLHRGAQRPWISAPRTSPLQGTGKQSPFRDPCHTLEVTLWHGQRGPDLPSLIFWLENFVLRRSRD